MSLFLGDNLCGFWFIARMSKLSLTRSWSMTITHHNQIAFPLRSNMFATVTQKFEGATIHI